MGVMTHDAFAHLYTTQQQLSANRWPIDIEHVRHRVGVQAQGSRSFDEVKTCRKPKSLLPRPHQTRYNNLRSWLRPYGQF
jgi:hypothetical protein